MSPFYERELGGFCRSLRRGEAIEFSSGPKVATVEILSDDFALVVPQKGMSVYVGKANSDGSRFKNDPERVGGRVLLNQESVSRNIRRPRVVWKNR